MAWAVPLTAPLATAHADVSWRAPFTAGELDSVAVDATDGDKVVAPGGAVLESFKFSGLRAGAKGYIVQSTVMDLKTGKSMDITGGAEFTPEAGAGTATVKIDLPADLAEGDYGVTSVLKAPDGTVIGTHHGLTSKAQQFTVGAPGSARPPRTAPTATSASPTSVDSSTTP